MKKQYFSFLFLIAFTSIAQTQKFGKISKEDLKETFYVKDSLANAVYLYKERKTALEFNQSKYTFEVVTKVHEKIKIYTTDGFKNATHIINYYCPLRAVEKEKVTGIKAYSYTLENGKIKKQKLSSKNIFTNQKNKYWATKTFTMPNINIGTIIEYKYTIRSPHWDIRDLDFQYEIPIKQLFYTTRIPEYFSFNKVHKGYYFIKPKTEHLSRSISFSSQNPENKETINIELTTYQKNDIPALSTDEPYISSINNYIGGIKYELSSTKFSNSRIENYGANWEAVSKTIFKSGNFGRQLEYSNYYKDDLLELLKGKTTNEEKIMSILNFVKHKVKWNGYTGKYTNKGVRKAYKEGSGNIAEINLMLVSMLRESGLAANPVLVSTRNHGIPLFPTRDGFNYVIAAVISEKHGYVLLDASEIYSSPNNLPLRDLNWQGRMITKDGRSTSISMIPKTYSESTNNLHITIDKDFNVNGILRRNFSGLKALTYRSKNNNTSEDNLIEKLENKYHIEISNFRISNKEKTTKPLSQAIQFESSDMIEVINNKMYINPLFFFTTKVNPFKLENRTYPVDYGTPWKKKTVVTLKIPTGYKIESIPENLGISLPDNLGVYKFLIKSNNTMISITSLETINTATIPSNYYKDLRGYYGEMVAKQKEKIILSKI